MAENEVNPPAQAVEWVGILEAGGDERLDEQTGRTSLSRKLVNNPLTRIEIAVPDEGSRCREGTRRSDNQKSLLNLAPKFIVL